MTVLLTPIVPYEYNAPESLFNTPKRRMCEQEIRVMLENSRQREVRDGYMREQSYITGIRSILFTSRRDENRERDNVFI